MAMPTSSNDGLFGWFDDTRSDRDSDVDTTASSFSTQSTVLKPIYKKSFPSSWSRSGSSVGTGSFGGSSVHSQDPRFATPPKPYYGENPPNIFDDNSYGSPLRRGYEDAYRRAEPSQLHVGHPPAIFGPRAQDFGRNPHGYPRSGDIVDTTSRPVDGGLPPPLPTNSHILFTPPKPRFNPYRSPEFEEERRVGSKSGGYDEPYRAAKVASGFSAGASAVSNSEGQISSNSASHDGVCGQESASYDVRYHARSTSSAYSTGAIGSSSKSAEAMNPIQEDV